MSELFLKAPKDAPVYFGGNSIIAKQFPLWGKGSTVRYWAERGMVHWEDSKDNSYSSMFWQEAAMRVVALNEMIFNSRQDGLYPDEIRQCQNFLADMEPVIRQAKEQGGPLDGASALAEHKRRRRTVHMQGSYKPSVACDPLEFSPPAKKPRAELRANTGRPAPTPKSVIIE